MSTLKEPTLKWKDHFLNFLQGSGGDGHTHASDNWRVLIGLSLLCGCLALAGVFLDGRIGIPQWLPIILFALSMLVGGWDALVDVVHGLPKGELDIHFLMIAVAIGASAIGAWSEGALLLFLFSLSGGLEAYAADKTQREISSLFEAAPKVALVRQDSGEFIEVAVESIQVGDCIQVRSGANFPVDAEITLGETEADESTLTGESIPVFKTTGDSVFSGTLNLWGTIECRVLRPAESSALQKIIQLIHQAQHLKAPSQRFTDRFGTGYTLLVILLTLVMFFVWWLGFGISAFQNIDGVRSAFYRAMTLLVVMSPCALVLSIPSTILAAIAWGARHGVLFRGGAAIEKLREINLVAMDKTGTLTTGELSVVSVESFPPGREQAAAELAYSLEMQGSHPIGRAIQRYGEAEGLRSRALTGFKAVSGRGVEALDGEALCLIGRREILEGSRFENLSREVPQASSAHIENWVYSGDLVARILLTDTLRKESKSILKILKRQGIRTVMLTGDRDATAQAVGTALEIDCVQAELSPEDKLNAVETFSKEGYRVAMLGDGVNDAPSLAAAHVSVAMGIRGSDAALEQSEVVLMRDRIDNFLSAVSISKRAGSIIRQNLAISLGTVGIMALAAMTGSIPLSLGVFAHEGSTVLVCLNSLRLLFVKPEPMY